MDRNARRPAWVQAMVFALTVGLTVLGPAETARADAVDRSVQLATEGLQLYNRGAYAEAYDKFYIAEQLAHSPVFSLYLARAKAGLGEYLAARELYRAVVKEELPEEPPATWSQAQQDAIKELLELDAKIPKLRIVTTPPDAAVMLDGKPQSERVIDVDPGEHKVEAIAGDRRAQQIVVVAEGAGTKLLTLAVQARKPSPAGPSGGPAPASGSAGDGRPGPLWPGIAVTSTGIAGLATGIALGSLALSLDDDLSSQCDAAGVCPPALSSDVDRLNAYEIGSTVGFIAGGVLTAVGVTLLIVRPGGEEAVANTSVRLSGQGLVLTSRF